MTAGNTHVARSRTPSAKPAGQPCRFRPRSTSTHADVPPRRSSRRYGVALSFVPVYQADGTPPGG